MRKRLLAGLICVVLLVSTMLTASMAENLKFGSQGSQVSQAQARLTQLGYYQGEFDGMFGYSTYLAVKGFQANNGLVVDGVIGDLTAAKLYSSGAINKAGAVDGSAYHLRIAYGDAGSTVSLVQGLLRNLNYYTGVVDGGFGYSTYLAVRDFQDLNGLSVDGVVGPLTWALLQSPAAIPKPVTPPPAVTPTPTPAPTAEPPLRLAYGDTGALVSQIQTKLLGLGYYAGPIDGTFGFATYLAVKDFQKVNLLKVDGVVGSLTWAKLFDAAALPKPTTAPTSTVLRIEYGDEGALVIQAQTRLAALGYYTLAIDGTFGYATYLAVRAFQEKNLLQVDGIIGQLTWDQLMSAGAIAK